MLATANFHVKTALFYLVIAALLGVILRMFAIVDVEATYKFIVHTHSHIALLGWVYLALTSILFSIGVNKQKKRKYQLIFWSTQITLVGMLIAFPIQGYALYSILFSTLFLICSYWFYFFFKRNHCLKSATNSFKFINVSLLFMILSSIGPWALGIIMNVLGNTSQWYFNAIYFYLHFQYNGWFIFCLIGLFLYVLEQKNIKLSNQQINLFFKLLTLSCVLTLFLSLLWIKPHESIYILAGIGAIIQIAAFIIFGHTLWKHANDIKKIFSPFLRRVLLFISILLVMKVLMQLVTTFPLFVVVTTELIDFVIGYLHLVFLGIVTLTLFVLLDHFQLIKISKFWLVIFILGFILSESLIFYKGITFWQQKFIFENYYATLIYCSALMPIGILGVFIKNLFFTDSTQLKSL